MSQKSISSGEQAIDQLEKGNVADATAWAEKVDLSCPIGDLIAAARIFHGAGVSEKVVQIYRWLQAVQPENRSWKIATACALGEHGSLDELEKTVSGLSLVSSELNLIGGAVLAGGHPAAAVQFYQRALSQNPQDGPTVIQLAAATEQMGEPQKASQLLHDFLKHPIDDDHLAAQIWFNLGVLLENDDAAAAEQAYRKSMQRSSDYDRPVANLALLMTRAGRFQDTIDFLTPQLEAKVDWPRTAMLLASACRLAGDQQQAIDVLQQVVDDSEHAGQTSGFAMAWEMLIRCLIENEQPEQAIGRCKQWMALAPDHPVAPHMLAAIEGTAAPARASSEYVAETFNGFADSFDAVLKNLQYRAPQLIGKLIQESLGAGQAKLSVLDAGCGTGLAGRFLRPYAKELTGVDLSSGMLAHAAKRGLYDCLQQCDLTQHLDDHAGTYDLIAAADTFNYFGDLSRLLPACFSALNRDGWLVFSLELGDTYGETWSLESHGRYAHPPGYLMEQLGQCGIDEGEMHRAVLRKENGVDVEGLLVAVQKPDLEDAPTERPVLE